MKSHQNEILEKMRARSYAELNFDFAFSLTNESERGAVLIGTSKIEVYLEKLLLAILPSQTKAYKNRLLNYPGALSSFSGKIELLYAFRYIDESLYISLNTLRKLRNEAAHSSDQFSLKNSGNQLRSIYSFEYGFPEVIQKLAYDNLIKWKLMTIKEGFEKSDLKDYDYEKIWDDKYPIPEEDENIAEQLVIWRLSYGLTFLCLKIDAVTDEYSLMRTNSGTLSELIGN